MIQIYAKEKKCIDLGRRGEDCARKVLFDISGWAELYGQGEAQLVAIREKDSAPYPVPVTQTNTIVTWVIKPVDNDQPGYGQCELVYVTNGSVVKSVIYQTHTDISLSDPVSPPDSPSTFISLQNDIKSLEKDLEDFKSKLESDETYLGFLVETDMLPSIYDRYGRIFTDNSGRIVLRY